MAYVTYGFETMAPGGSPIGLCDRLLTLAQEADRAGMPGAASRLVDLASTVLVPLREASRPANHRAPSGGEPNRRRGPHQSQTP